MRTWLFVPGHDAPKIRKALALDADAVIVDWEDAVPAQQKDAAREITAALLAQTPTSRRLVVRINGARDAGHTADIAALPALPIAAVMLPKAEEPDVVAHLAEVSGLPVIALVESALGVERAFEIAGAHARVERLAFGSLDFLADVGGQWSPQGEGFLYARSRVVVAGRAAGLAGAVDGVYPQLDDPDGLRQDAALARRLGFAGKLLLHPAQIAIVRDAFAPTPDEIAQAARIVRAFEEALAANRAAVSLDGRFVDPPVVRWAQQVLREAGAETTDEH